MLLLSLLSKVDLFELLVPLRTNAHQNPLHRWQLPLAMHVSKVLDKLLAQVFSSVRPEQILPVRLLSVAIVLNGTPTARFNDRSTLILQEEPLCGVV